MGKEGKRMTEQEAMYRICGACGKAHDLTRGKYHYCYNCGTKVDWSEE